MKKILLLSMPAAPINSPPLQIAVLKAFLRQHGISADAMYPNVNFADRIGYYKYLFHSANALFNESCFSALLYPQMQEKAEFHIRKKNRKFNYNIVFKQAKLFIDETVHMVPWGNYEYIGFSVVFFQLFSSLVLARRIKEISPKVKIIFGGHLCNGEKGSSLMEVYPEIDYAISYEGEYPLLYLMQGQPPENIPALTYRKNNKVIINPPGDKIVCLDNLPLPDFSDYFNCINRTKRIKKTKIFLKDRYISVEASRSCWWNKCTFCALNTSYLKYREKSVGRIVREIKTQISKYGLHKICFADNNMIIRGTSELLRALKPLRLEIVITYNAQLRDFKLLQLLKEAGADEILFGLESLSKTLLEEKIKKGVRLIDNIQMLKWLKELNMASAANMITSYPNETREEFKEAIRNFKFIYHLEPPYLVKFDLEYGSPIFNNPSAFNIKKIFPARWYRYLFPQQVLNRLILDSYNFLQAANPRHPKHILKREFNKWVRKFVNYSVHPLLYYTLKDNLVIVVDKRGNNIDRYYLDKKESDIYLFCHGARNLNEIKRQFPLVSCEDLIDILNRFVRHRLMFKEDDDYISLAIDWHRHRRYLLKDGIKNHHFSIGRSLRSCF